MSSTFTQPPLLTVGTPYTSSASTSTSASASSSSIMIVIIIIASAVITSASIYLLLRVVSKRFRRSFSTADDVISRRGGVSSNHVPLDDLTDSLPLFTFRAVTRNLNDGSDCAVCLSKFEPHDQLRLLPLCCHAFHAACIDKWIVNNQTCPLCRSTVLLSGSNVLDKIQSSSSANNSFRDGNRSGSGSFRIELGSISLRRGGAAAEEEEAVRGARRTYSVGSYEYIVDDYVYEVGVECTSHGKEYSGLISNDKESSVSGRRNWLREYMASISSRTMSFRSSGRFFFGRSDAVVVPEDLEAHRAGEEISEVFRWISGI